MNWTLCIKVAQHFTQYVWIQTLIVNKLWVKVAQHFTQYLKIQIVNNLCKFKHELHTLRKSSTTFYAICLNSNMNYTLCVKVAQHFKQSV